MIDRLFGTYAWIDEAVELGIDDRELGNGNPAFEMVAVQWRWLVNMLPRGRGARATPA